MIQQTHKRTNGRPDINRRYVGWSRLLDIGRRYLTDAPTPEKFATLQKAVDAGDYAAAVEMCHEMEGKDDRLQSVAARRREGLTGLEWSCEPNPSAKDQDLAKKAAEFCQGQLARLRTWPGTLKHFANDGIGPGIAVTELVWERARLVKTTDAPGHRLTDDLVGESPDVFIRTEFNITPGVRAAYPKFVVHMPQQRAGYKLQVTLGRATMKLWLFKHYGWSDRMAWSEKFGMPTAQFKFPAGTTTETRTEIRNYARDAMADGFMLTPEDVELILHSVSGDAPHRDIVADIDTAYAVLWLGQTLTTDNTNTGSRALGSVHENTKASIAASDIKEEAETIEQQVLRPMVRFRFPMQPDAPIPKWTRKIIEERNLAADQLDMERIRYAREQQLPLDEAVVYERLGLPQPTGATP